MTSAPIFSKAWPDVRIAVGVVDRGGEIVLPPRYSPSGAEAGSLAAGALAAGPPASSAPTPATAVRATIARLGGRRLPRERRRRARRTGARRRWRIPARRRARACGRRRGEGASPSSIASVAISGTGASSSISATIVARCSISALNSASGTTRVSPSAPRSVTRSWKMSFASTFSSPSAWRRMLPFLREALAALHVELVLVAQAAHQAPARARDLRRIERELLVLRDLQVHRAQLGQPRRRAVLAAAAADAAEPLRLVAHADLLELDAGAEQPPRDRARARGNRRASRR